MLGRCGTRLGSRGGGERKKPPVIRIIMAHDARLRKRYASNKAKTSAIVFQKQPCSLPILHPRSTKTRTCSDGCLPFHPPRPHLAHSSNGRPFVSSVPRRLLPRIRSCLATIAMAPRGLELGNMLLHDVDCTCLPQPIYQLRNMGERRHKQGPSLLRYM